MLLADTLQGLHGAQRRLEEWPSAATDIGDGMAYDVPLPGCLSRIEKSQFLTDRDVAESAAGCRAGRQQFIDLMVERVAVGEAPSSPQPPEAGARRARLYGASSAAENGNRQTMPSSRCECGDRGRFSRL